jgi:hypothetical protein
MTQFDERDDAVPPTPPAHVTSSDATPSVERVAVTAITGGCALAVLWLIVTIVLVATALTQGSCGGLSASSSASCGTGYLGVDIAIVALAVIASVVLCAVVYRSWRRVGPRRDKDAAAH